MSPDQSLLEAALALAADGRAVFPYAGVANMTCTCWNGADCDRTGKHPLVKGGFKAATTDPVQIRRWWTEFPDANIGAATGNGYLVVDIDERNGGLATIQSLVAEHGGFPPTLATASGGGGAHLHYTYSSSLKVPSKDGLFPGVDIKADPGAIIRPPSNHKSGGRYRYAGDGGPAMAPAPQWLLDILIEPMTDEREGAAEPRGHRESSEPRITASGHFAVPEGRRNAHLFSLAGAMRRKGVSESLIADTLLTFNTESCSPPLIQREVLSIARSSMRYAPESVPNLESPDPFPIAALPQMVRRYVEEAAEAGSMPIEYVAVPLLSAAGAAMGREWYLDIKEESWREFPVVWTAVVGRSGAGKTPALRHGTEALRYLQHEANVRYEQALRAQALSGSGKKEPPPEREHFLTTNATAEALAPMLSASAGLLLIHDEVVGLVRSFDAYKPGKGTDRQEMLSSWSSTALKIDRKTSATITVEDPVICITGGIQPRKLPELAGEAAQDDGFLQRFQISWPNASPQRFSRDDISRTAKDALRGAFERLRHRGVSTQVVLSPDALEAFIEFHDAAQERAYNAQGVLAGVESKSVNHAARWALILFALSVCEQPPDEDEHSNTFPNPKLVLGVDDMQRGIQLARYFVSQVDGVLGAVGRAPSRSAVKLRRAFEQTPGWLARTELYRATGNRMTAEEMDAGLRELLAEGSIEEEEAAPGERLSGQPRHRYVG